MKNITIIFISLFLLLSCKTENLNKDGFKGTVISGKTTSEFANKPIYLKYILNDSVITMVDTVSSNKKFKFTVTETEYPLKAFLTNDNNNYAPNIREIFQLSRLIYFDFGSPFVPLQSENPLDIKLFLLEQGNIDITIKDSIYNSQISNSKLNDELNELNKDLKIVMGKSIKLNKINMIEITDRKVLDSLMAIGTQINLEKTTILDKFISEHRNSYSSAYAFNIKPFMKEKDSEVFREINPEIRNSKLAESGRTKLKRFVNTIRVSDTIENFTLLNQNGNPVSLSDIKAKFILVDFWASWCTPCRKEIREIIKFYSDFNKNDFQVVSISVDESKAKWIKALKDDNIPWTSLIDNSLVVNDKLGVTGYPTTFLIDSNHKIIEMNLAPEKLKERLIQLLE